MRTFVLLSAMVVAVCGRGPPPPKHREQQRPPRQPPVSLPDDVEVKAIAPPDRPLPPESATARVTRFSFIAYGDTRSSGPSRSGEPPEDGRMLQRAHGLVVEAML